MKFFLVLVIVSVFGIANYAGAEAKRKAPPAKSAKTSATPEPEETAPAQAPFQSDEDIGFYGGNQSQYAGFFQNLGFYWDDQSSLRYF